MPVSYYGDLSGESSIDDSESSSDDESSSLKGGGVRDEADQRTSQEDVNGTDVPLENIWSRCILHLDIDCFYCQCEEIDRNLKHPRRPLAIGQKHIIVTCNYEARRYGVKKLQLRESAMAACPHLLIVEGSDLLRYKRHSRKVYEAFRLALKELAGETGTSIPAKKGCMDEMMADLSQVVNQMLQVGDIPDDDTTVATKDKSDDVYQYYQSNFVHGDSDAPVTLVEDQTGQTTTVTSSLPSSLSPSENKYSNSHSKSPDRILPPSRRNIHDAYCDGGTSKMDQQLLCIQRLHLAGRLVARVCRTIVQETGFYTTGGISVSPLLAKLASDLNKPKSVNLLFPWRSSPLLYSMPLRKLHGLGNRTMKALDPCLPSKNNDDVKTVLDLLQVPQESIAQCLQSLHAYQESGSMKQCELLILRCRGLDVSEIEDDQGGLPKTVSIENSFRRNTVKTQIAVQKGLEDLLHRLPLLLNDRTSWARDPENAYPTTIRVTVRLVDQNLVLRQDGTTMTESQRRRGRRPYVTTSRQSSFTNGKALILEKDTEQQSRILKKWVEPLLEQLLSKAARTNTINLTRLNIALTNFQDTANTNTLYHRTTTTASHPTVSFSQSFFGSNESESKRTSVEKASTTSSNKKPKIETPARSKQSGTWSARTPRVLPSSNPEPRTSIQTQLKSFTSMPSKQPSNRMKATTIDNFFYRKPK